MLGKPQGTEGKHKEHKVHNQTTIPIDFNFYQFKDKCFSVKIEIAGLTVRILTESSKLYDSAKIRYNDFITSNRNSFLDIHVHLSPAVYFPNPNGTDDFFNEQVFEKSRCVVCSNFFTGYIDLNTNYAKVVCADSNPLSWLEHFLRITYAVTALQLGDLLFHGAALIKEGKAYVFFGPSGSGKSTVTELSRNCTILGDDLIIIKKKDNWFRAYATPFNSQDNNEFQITNTNAKITGLYRLIHNKATSIKKMSPANTLSDLLMSIPPVNKNYNGSKTAIDLCTRIVQSIPCYELYFKRNEKFWKHILINSDQVPILNESLNE